MILKCDLCGKEFKKSEMNIYNATMRSTEFANLNINNRRILCFCNKCQKIINKM